MYAAYGMYHVVYLQGSGVKHNVPEDQRPLLWKTFGDIFAWIKEFNSNTSGEVHFPLHFQLLENSL